MANKEKLLLLAMLSMILPGALPEEFASPANAEGKKPSKRSMIAPITSKKDEQNIDLAGAKTSPADENNN